MRHLANQVKVSLVCTLDMIAWGCAICASCAGGVSCVSVVSCASYVICATCANCASSVSCANCVMFITIRASNRWLTVSWDNTPSKMLGSKSHPLYHFQVEKCTYYYKLMDQAHTSPSLHSHLTYVNTVEHSYNKLLYNKFLDITQQ